MYNSLIKQEDQVQDEEKVETHAFPSLETPGSSPRITPSTPQFQSLLDSGGIKSRSGQVHGGQPSLADPDLEAKILEEARRKAELIEREAYEKGYRQGELAGQEIGKKKYQSAVKSLEAALKEVQKVRAQVFKDLESTLVQLAMAVARKVVHGELQLNPEVVLQTIRAACRELVDKNLVKVRLNPSDFQYALEYKEHLLEDTDGLKDLVFEADPGVDKGGAILETDYGDIDARIGRQLERIEKSVFQVLREREVESK